MERRLFEATCGTCSRAGLEGDEARITGYGDLTGWRHDRRPAKAHSPHVTGTMREIHKRAKA